MRRKKAVSQPVWFIWEGEEFPRQIHSDSIVFYLNEHVYLDSDDIAKKSLATTLLQEGISESIGHSYRLIDSSIITRAGYCYEGGDDRFPLYCEDDSSFLDYDATFVEVAYVD